MGTPEDLRKEFPSVMNRAYKQYKRFRRVEDRARRAVAIAISTLTNIEKETCIVSLI